MPHAASAIQEAIAADPSLAQHIADVRVSARRKTLGMSMKPGDPGITVHVPAGVQPDDVVTLLSRSRDRIGAMLVKAREVAPDHPVKRYVSGEGYLWLGRSYRLRLVGDAPEPVQLVHTGQWWMQLTRVAARQGARPFIDWYSREGTRWLHPEVSRWWWLMAPGRPAPTVRVADIGYRRWGVYDGTTHEVRIAWQTLQLQPRLIRHVLVHELVHATRPSGKPHGPEFWRAFTRTMPGARQDQRDLVEAGRHIWMGDIA